MNANYLLTMKIIHAYRGKLRQPCKETTETPKTQVESHQIRGGNYKHIL